MGFVSRSLPCVVAHVERAPRDVIKWNRTNYVLFTLIAGIPPGDPCRRGILWPRYVIRLMIHGLGCLDAGDDSQAR